MYKDHIKPLYSWWEKASEADEVTGKSKQFEDLMPIEITSTSDMIATWKMGDSKSEDIFLPLL